MEHENLELIIKDLSVSLYTELCDLDKSFLSKSIQDLLQSDTSSLLKKMKVLYNRLLDTQKSIKEVEFYSQFSENEGYQKALQKLDSEVRNHIKHELQMKMYIDNLDEKLQNADKTNHIVSETKEFIEKLVNERKRLKSSVSLKINELEELKKSFSANTEHERVLLKEKNLKENEKIAEVEREVLKIKQKCAQAKIELDYVNIEYEREKSEFLRLKSSLRNSDVSKRLNKSIDKKEEVKIQDDRPVRVSKSPIKAENSVSPIRNSYKSIAKKNAGLAKSTNKLEKNPFIATLKKELNKSKTKPKLQVYLVNKK